MSTTRHLWWLREGKNRMMLHSTNRCANRRRSGAMPPPKLIELDDLDAALYRICGLCARGEQRRLWDLLDD